MIEFVVNSLENYSTEKLLLFITIIIQIALNSESGSEKRKLRFGKSWVQIVFDWQQKKTLKKTKKVQDIKKENLTYLLDRSARWLLWLMSFYSVSRSSNGRFPFVKMYGKRGALWQLITQCNFTARHTHWASFIYITNAQSKAQKKRRCCCCRNRQQH